MAMIILKNYLMFGQNKKVMEMHKTVFYQQNKISVDDIY